jgi:hypothetical protein
MGARMRQPVGYLGEVTLPELEVDAVVTEQGEYAVMLTLDGSQEIDLPADEARQVAEWLLAAAAIAEQGQHVAELHRARRPRWAR